jgi:hypothetical protein
VGNFEPIFGIIEQAKSFGFRELENGARLYGHVPHVAPQAWLHLLFAPLSDQDVMSLEKNMGQTIPSDFREFLFVTNGIGLFSCSLSIYGKRTSYVRTGDAAWQPFCIVTANTLERPEHIKPWQIVIGSYQSDGSKLFLDGKDGIAFRTKIRSKKV